LRFEMAGLLAHEAKDLEGPIDDGEWNLTSSPPAFYV
jgi:hypothetical protein